MIRLKYKCKVNFVKLPLIWIYRCLKMVFKNASAGRKKGCRSVVYHASSSSSFNLLFLMWSASSRMRPSKAFRVSSWQTRFTRGRVRELKNAHNSITVQNRTHVYMNFFDHNDLGNHLLQLCPKVEKHPVYVRYVCVCVCVCIYIYIYIYIYIGKLYSSKCIESLKLPVTSSIFI